MAQAKGAIAPSTQVETPETYLGTYRAQSYTQQLHANADFDYGVPPTEPTNAVGLSGHWRVGSHQIVAGAGAKLVFEYVAPRIYVVAAPPTGGPVTLRSLRRRVAEGVRLGVRRRPLPARAHADRGAAQARAVRARGHVALLVHLRVDD